ncbi:tRNA pseudouridine(38/39) synthase [Malassezia psittaci]|uniref:tRNA pseudouridine(38/39) synthase n=1 Tax=Malassezia psittaci TaxID=1821823 RepID=A0AAF0FDA0_9BASI|nr:tRNA pseudouridine(38/39) synthase [Malassezia psittaci]
MAAEKCGDRLSILLEWCNDHGIVWEDRIQVQRVPEIADQHEDAEWNAEPGAFSVIARSMITAGENPYERYLGNSSDFNGYLQSLPDSVALPLVWQHDWEGLKWFNGTEASRLHTYAEDHWNASAKLKPGYSQVGLVLMQRRLQAYWDGAGAKVLRSAGAHLKFDQFLHAFTLVSSRAFLINIYHGLCMVPFADLLNHTDTHNTVVQAEEIVCLRCGLLHDGACGKSEKNYTINNTIDVRCISDLDAGEEVINTYGDLSNAELLCQYGFVLDSRTHLERCSWRQDLRQDLSELELALSRFMAYEPVQGPMDSSLTGLLVDMEPEHASIQLRDDKNNPRAYVTPGGQTLDFAPMQSARDRLYPLFIDSMGRPSWCLWCLFLGAALVTRSHSIKGWPSLLANVSNSARTIDSELHSPTAATLLAKKTLHCLFTGRIEKLHITHHDDEAITLLFTGSAKFIMEAYERYGDWSRSQLLRRIAQLEASASAGNSIPPKPEQAFSNDVASDKPKSKAPREYDVSKQPCRKIALRFAYDGARYSGLAAQTQQVTPLPTVEETIWEALCTSRLVDPLKGMDGAGWSRCGRTDAGVSAAGQVIALYVRSRCIDERAIRESNADQSTIPQPVRIADGEELPYVATLNRLLPPSIRVQAWSPVRSSFSARFDCTYRHYKYFFTGGAPRSLAWHPGYTSNFSQQLDIQRMQDAASRLVGEHDFRNLCKVDASKQITNFVRRIDGATIDRVSSGWPTSEDRNDQALNTPTMEPMYVLNLRGSAFLYHQVRNIMAVLFLVGSHLEEPNIVDELVNVYQGAAQNDRGKILASLALDSSEPTSLRLCSEMETLNVYETKPSYEMAADRPLMLWECGFNPEDVRWRACTNDSMDSMDLASMDYTPTLRATTNLHAQWTRETIHAELLRHMTIASASSSTSEIPSETAFEEARFPLLPTPVDLGQDTAQAQLVPLGNGTIRPTTKYTAMVQRPRDVPPSVKNEKWREGKGRRRAERWAAAVSERSNSLPSSDTPI